MQIPVQFIMIGHLSTIATSAVYPIGGPLVLAHSILHLFYFNRYKPPWLAPELTQIMYLFKLRTVAPFVTFA